MQELQKEQVRDKSFDSVKKLSNSLQSPEPAEGDCHVQLSHLCVIWYSPPKAPKSGVHCVHGPTRKGQDCPQILSMLSVRQETSTAYCVCASVLESSDKREKKTIPTSSPDPKGFAMIYRQIQKRKLGRRRQPNGSHLKLVLLRIFF